MKFRASTLARLCALVGAFSGALLAQPAAASPDKAAAPAAAASPALIDVPALYAQHCAACHAPNRLGAMGPALLPDNLGRLRKSEAAKVIAEGRPATQMAGFAAQMSKEEIAALTEWIYTPVVPEPRWTDDDIRASRVVHVDPATLSARPVFDADPMNLFLVVEAGDHHVSVLDGDKLEPIFRFQSRFALHGGPKFAAEGRYVFFASRDGWITKFDLW
ncbi:MAG: nitrite reductase, partial [Thauera sp.]|nr:nitrite reductase [Thauera sp.]